MEVDHKLVHAILDRLCMRVRMLGGVVEIVVADSWDSCRFVRAMIYQMFAEMR